MQHWIGSPTFLRMLKQACTRLFHNEHNIESFDKKIWGQLLCMYVLDFILDGHWTIEAPPHKALTDSPRKLSCSDSVNSWFIWVELSRLSFWRQRIRRRSGSLLSQIIMLECRHSDNSWLVELNSLTRVFGANELGDDPAWFWARSSCWNVTTQTNWVWQPECTHNILKIVLSSYALITTYYFRITRMYT